MSTSRPQFRKTPKTPFIAGNLLLAALGTALVFFGPDPFSVSTVLLVALCLATGGVLTLLPFLLDQFALLNLHRSRYAQAAVNMKAAVASTEEILEKLEERDATENPLRLVSERLPELVETKIGEAVAKGTGQADSTRAEILEGVKALSTLPGALEKLHDEVRAFAAHGATREYMGVGLENLENHLHRLETLLEEWKRNQLFGTPPETPPAPTVVESEKENPGTSQPVKPDKTTRPEPPIETDQRPDSETGPEVPEAEDDPPPRVPSEQVSGEEEPRPSPAKRRSRKGRKAQIIASAFVGIQNGVFLRGDGAGLDKETGKRMEMTGIGEWAWEAEIDAPLTAELYLNDSQPSDLGRFKVAPGDVLKLNPSFTGKPKSDQV